MRSLPQFRLSPHLKPWLIVMAAIVAAFALPSLLGYPYWLPLGIALAAMISGALASEGLTFALPVGSLIAFTIVAFVAGVLAAIAPARRASRLDVLKALQYE